MDQFREIGIYLAYAPEDEPYDREALGNYIRQQNDIARTHRDPVFLRLIECEDRPYAPEEADLVMSLSICHGGGLELLQQLLQQEDGPKVIPCFHTPAAGVAVDDSYKALQDFLQEKNRYWTEYKDAAVVMFKLLVYLQQNKDGISYEVKDGQICMDGKVLLESKDFTFLTAHPELKMLREQIDELDEELEAFRRSGDFRAYKELLDRRDELHRQKMQIIQNYYAYLEKSEQADSDRLRRARQAVEQGDLAAAQQILDIAMIRQHTDENKEHREAAKAKAEAQAKQELKARRQEYLELARILRLQIQNEERIALVQQALLEAANLEEREDLGMEAREEYITYLLLWTSSEEAVPAAKALAKGFGEDQISPEHARAKMLLAKAYLLEGTDAAEGVAAYAKAVEIWRALYDQDPQMWISQWADCCNTYAMVCVHHSDNNSNKAIKMLEEVIYQVQQLPENHYRQALRLLFMLKCSTGQIRLEQGDFEEAEYDYQIAEGLMQAIEEEKDRDAEISRMILDEQMGELYLKMGEYAPAVQRCRNSIRLYQTLPAEAVQDHFHSHCLCQMYLGSALSRLGSGEQAEAPLQTALQIMCTKASHNLHDQVRMLNIYAELTYACARQKDRKDAAREYLAEAEALLNQLEDQYEERVHEPLITSCLMLADACLHICEKDKATQEMAKAVALYQRSLDLHRELEIQPGFRAGQLSWSVVIKYAGILTPEDRAAYKALYQRIKKWGEVKPGFSLGQQCICYYNYSLILDRAGKIPEAERSYITTKAIFRKALEQDFGKNVRRYAELISLYSRLLEKKSNGSNLAINMLKEEKLWAETVTATPAQQRLLCHICEELHRIYTYRKMDAARKAIGTERDNIWRKLKDRGQNQW